MTAVMLANHRRVAPFGVAGGMPGASAATGSSGLDSHGEGRARGTRRDFRSRDERGRRVRGADARWRRIRPAAGIAMMGMGRRGFPAASCASRAGNASGRRSTICSPTPIRRAARRTRCHGYIELLRWVRVHQPPACEEDERRRRRVGRRVERSRCAARSRCCACGSRASGSCCNSWTGIRVEVARWPRRCAQCYATRTACAFRHDRAAAGVWVLGRGGAARGSPSAAGAPGVRRPCTGVRRAVPGPGRRDDAACVADGDARACPGVIPLRRGAGRGLLDGGSAGSRRRRGRALCASGRHRTLRRDPPPREPDRALARSPIRGTRSRRRELISKRLATHAEPSVASAAPCAARRGNPPGVARALDDVTGHSPRSTGVSVGIVYKIELSRQLLGRIEASSRSPPASATAGRRDRPVRRRARHATCMRSAAFARSSARTSISSPGRSRSARARRASTTSRAIAPNTPTC